MNRMKSIFKGETGLSTVLIKGVIIIFISTVVFKLLSIGYGFVNKYEKDTSMYIIDTVAKKIKDMDHIDDTAKNELAQLINEFNRQNNNGLYRIYITRYAQSSYIEYKYAKGEPENFLSKVFESENGWYISYNISEAQANSDYEKQNDSLPARLGNISNYLFLVSAVGLVVVFTRKLFNNN